MLSTVCPTKHQRHTKAQARSLVYRSWGLGHFVLTESFSVGFVGRAQIYALGMCFVTGSLHVRYERVVETANTKPSTAPALQAPTLLASYLYSCH